jgi:catechol 2,3-dioxygenase-like lactoylglutathione lyase family enzyme
MFSHITIGVADLDRAIGFYDALLAPLGLARQETDLSHGLAGYAPGPDLAPSSLWLMRPIDGRPATAGNGTTVAFDAPDRAAVRRWHAGGLAAGARDEGGPGLRPHYHPHFYGAYLRDADGHKLCCVCHRAEHEGTG